MTLAAGSRLGPYEILAPLGAGGMGEVYRARDSRLGREVAVKILPGAVSEDSERLARFDREARTLATLNDPHILAVHDVGTENGTAYIVSELLEGETLRQHLGRHRLTVREAAGYAAQMARGLAAAHEKGVVHRDLKPANVFVTRDGAVKILDFGLARITRPEPPTDRTAATATAEPDTADGAVLGTVDYMSPEQVRGQAVDHRSDVFAFGTVLYEMLTGERPFRGDSVADTASAILTQDPPKLSPTHAEIPAPLSRIVRRCLEKKPEKRLHSLADLAVDLEEIAQAGGAATRRRGWRLAAGVVAAAVALGGGFLLLRSRGAASRPASEVPAERQMLVVLPFENLGPREDAYFASGMTDEITSRLARVSGLGVISRTSAVQYDRSGKTVKEIGSDLGVGFVLEGSVRWERQEDGPGRVRISPRLIRVADDTHLWARSYERELEGIFETQSEIAQAVVDQLGVTLLPHERSGVESRPTQSLAAYQAYLRGRELLANPDYPREDLELAVDLLERAVDLDPEFAGAHAELSRAHTQMFYVDYDSTPERLEKARESADRAVALDPTAPDGHKALGEYYHHGLHDHEKALEELTRAAELLPNDSEIAHAMGDVAWEQGRWDEARAHLERAAELDPRNAACAASLGVFFRHIRLYDRAVHWFDTQISLAPDSASGYLMKSAVYLDWGLPDRAREALESAPGTEDRHLLFGWVALELQEDGQAALDRLSDAPDVLEFMWGKFPTALLRAWAYDAMNDSQRARASYAAALETFERIRADAPDDILRRRNLVAIYSGLGRESDALREARHAVEEARRKWGPAHMMTTECLWGLANVYARFGEYERSLDELEYLLSVPSLLSYGRLRDNAGLDPLRDHPRFQKLLAEAERDLPSPPPS